MAQNAEPSRAELWQHYAQSSLNQTTYGVSSFTLTWKVKKALRGLVNFGVSQKEIAWELRWPCHSSLIEVGHRLKWFRGHLFDPKAILRLWECIPIVLAST